MEITLDQLKIAIPNSSASNREQYLQYFNETFAEFDINTAMRIAHFLAQIAWESGSLKYTEEIASGKAYEKRKDLGNTKEGDGVRFKGRGLIQITGRTNYRQYLEFSLGRKLEESENKDETDQYKHLLSKPKDAVRSAGWFWKNHKLNQLADKDEFTKITRIINGSSKTVPKRLPCLRNAKIAMGLIKTKETNKQQNKSNNLSSNNLSLTDIVIVKTPNLLNVDFGLTTSFHFVPDGCTLINEKYQISMPVTMTMGNPYALFSSHI